MSAVRVSCNDSAHALPLAAWRATRQAASGNLSSLATATAAPAVSTMFIAVAFHQVGVAERDGDARFIVGSAGPAAMQKVGMQLRMTAGPAIAAGALHRRFRSAIAEPIDESPQTVAAVSAMCGDVARWSDAGSVSGSRFAGWLDAGNRSRHGEGVRLVGGLARSNHPESHAEHQYERLAHRKSLPESPAGGRSIPSTPHDRGSSHCTHRLARVRIPGLKRIERRQWPCGRLQSW